MDYTCKEKQYDNQNKLVFSYRRMVEYVSYQNFAIVLAGILGGIVDASVGGGGFIMLSITIALGIEGHIALGANKVVILVGSLFTIYRFHKMSMIDWRAWEVKSYFISIIASIVGSIAIVFSSSSIIYKMSGPIMGLLLLYELHRIFHKTNDIGERTISMSSFIWIFCSLIGFYTGFFGPGSTTIWIVVICVFLGKDILWAMSNCKLFSLVSSIPGVIVFLLQSLIQYDITLFLIIGYLVGSEIGILITIRYGIRCVNVLLITMLATLTVVLTERYYF